MWFLGLIGFIAIIGLLWVISRNTGEALDKQAALHYEIANLNKRLEALTEKKPEKVIDASSLTQSPVNVNQASLEELTSLPGVGKVLGQRIIDARPMSDTDDLAKVQGLSADLLNKLKSRLVF